MTYCAFIIVLAVTYFGALLYVESGGANWDSYVQEFKCYRTPIKLGIYGRKADLWTCVDGNTYLRR